MFDIDESSQTFGTVISAFNYRSALPAAKLLDGPVHGKELCEIALSPVDRNVVLLNIRRTNLVRYNIASREAKLIDVKSLNVTNKTFFFGATFSYNGRVIPLTVNLVINAGSPLNAGGGVFADYSSKRRGRLLEDTTCPM